MTKNGDLKFNHRSLDSAGDKDRIDIYFSHLSFPYSHWFSQLPELAEGTSSSELCPSCQQLCRDVLPVQWLSSDK